MSGHTPGPWATEDNGEIWGDGMQVCRVNSSDDFPCIRTAEEATWCDEMCEANITLIAAAPDLLEACKEALRHCLCTFAERRSGHLVDCFAPRLEAAIAKAEGIPNA